MESIDEHWTRLTEHYGQMADEELQALADQGYELTEMAKEALRGEISRRRLNIQLRTEPLVAPAELPVENPEFNPGNLDLQSAGRVFDFEEARRHKAVLDEVGIPCYFGPDHIENVELLKPLFDTEDAEARKRGFSIGIQMSIPSADMQRAVAARAQAWADGRLGPAEPEVEADYLAVCPRCHSPEIVLDDVEGKAETDPAAGDYNWHCDACGYKWKDDGVEQQAS